MSCPHGKNSTPKTCSQCLGVRGVKRVTIAAGEVRVNGRRVAERVQVATSLGPQWTAGYKRWSKRKPNATNADSESGEDAAS